MMRETSLIAALFIVVLVGTAACGAGQRGEDALVEEARAIHERVITLDTHADIPFNFASDEVDPGVRGDRQVDLPKMRDGGLDVAFFIVYVGQRERTPEDYEWATDAAMQKFDGIRRMAYELYPEQIELAYTADDVARIWAEGKLVASIGIENGFAIGRDLSLLERYHELGARYAGLVHNGHNDVADSAQPRLDFGDPREEHGGLSDFGRDYVREANRLGMMVDISHASMKASVQAMEYSRAPIIASHSGVKALADHPRNLDDDALLALRENGGVVQIVALDAFVKVQPPERGEAVQEIRARYGITGFADLQALDAETRAAYETEIAALDERWPPANVSDLVDHIDYAVGVIGIDHVGISSDFDGGGGIVGWNDASETFNVTLELARRGYSEEDIAKLWSGNLLRVWREVERTASEMQQELATAR